jgi:hypothetical protein
LDYITITYLKLSRNFIFPSDNSPGRNRNHTVVKFLAKLAANGRFNKIFQYFVVKGHSFLPCDKDFGLVKKVLFKIRREKSIVDLLSNQAEKGSFQ